LPYEVCHSYQECSPHWEWEGLSSVKFWICRI
jgi:hypothetical protein